ncbi:MAG TPA: hypothetical protein VGG20_18685, partial [Thermoanaerobaculia bacterium]
MTKAAWKRFGIATGALTVLAVGVAVSLQAAAVPPVTCNGSKDHIIHIYGGPPVHVATTGHLTAGVGTTFVTSDGRKGTNLTVQDVFSTGKADGIGAATFSLDTTRQAGPSAIVENKAGTGFPATQTMQFHFNLDLNGHTYRSINAASVTNTTVAA